MRLIDTSVHSFARFVGGGFLLPLEKQGLVLVEGRNRDSGDAFDSNGAGKTMLFEAITWSLFGKMLRYGDERIGADEVCYAGNPAMVGTAFETSKGKFQAVRIRRPTGAQSFVLSSWGEHEDQGGRFFGFAPIKSQTTDQSSAKAADDVTKLLGFDYTTLRAALFLQGGTLGVSTFAREMKIIESILRFDVFTEGAKIAGERVKIFDAGSRSKIDEMAGLSEQITTLQQAIADLDALNETGRERELLVAVKAAGKALRGFGDARQQATAAVQAYEESQDRNDRANGDVRVAQSRLDRLDGIEGKNTCPTCEQSVVGSYRKRLLREARSDLAAAETVAVEARGIASNALVEHNATRKRVLELADAEREVEEHERELAGIQARKQTRLAKIAEQRARLGAIESRLKALTDDVAQIRRHGGIAKQGKQVLDGCKPEVLTGALPVLNGAADVYSNLLTDGALRVEFDLFRESRSDDLIRVSGETAKTYAGLSAGEKRRADLIIVLARRALARWRVGEPINISLWDEVLDPLDESGLRRAMAVLQQDMDELESVFVVSHRPEVRDLFPSAATWTVVREGGVSRLVR